MPSKTILVLGAGPRTGLSIIKKFSQNGYKTIGVSRNPSAELLKTADLAISADLYKHESIQSIFSEVKSKIGVPNVVIYNSSAAHFTPASEPFSVSVEDFIQDANLNVVSAFAALKYALDAFKELPGEEKTFIYTGNGLTNMNDSRMMTGVLGKRAGLGLIENAVAAHGGDARFYFADERAEDAKPVYGAIDGDAHGEFYFELVQKKEQGPFQATFVKGKGYVDFEGRTGPK